MSGRLFCFRFEGLRWLHSWKYCPDKRLFLCALAFCGNKAPQLSDMTNYAVIGVYVVFSQKNSPWAIKQRVGMTPIRMMFRCYKALQIWALSGEMTCSFALHQVRKTNHENPICILREVCFVSGVRNCTPDRPYEDVRQSALQSASGTSGHICRVICAHSGGKISQDQHMV